MSNAIASRSALPAWAAGLTLAGLRDQIVADKALPLRKRQDVSSALNTLARVLGKPPEEIPVHPGYIRERLEGFTPAMAGLKPGRWHNVMSLFRFAREHVGLARVPGRYKEPLAPAWAELYRHLNDSKARYGLSRLAHYCSAAGIAPGQVDDRIIEAFFQDLMNDEVTKKPTKIRRSTCTLWNRAVAAIPAWPKRVLTVACYRNPYVLPWSVFPGSLKTELDAYLGRLSGKDILAQTDFRPLRPRSIETRTKQLRMYISAIVHRGHDPQRLRSLADLVPVGTVLDGLRFFLDRAGGKPTKQLYEIACVVKNLARHGVHVEEAHLKGLKALCRTIKDGLGELGIGTGPSPKNQDRLRQFNDPANVMALVMLPPRIMAGMRGVKKPTHAQALDVQTALAVELLLMAALRITNLTEIDLDRHLVRSRPGGVVNLAIPASEVKNRSDIDAILPAESVRLLDQYLTLYRPVLLKEPSNWLFPGRDSRKPKSTAGLRQQIVNCVARRCGLRIHPHLFRHFGAKSFLDANPGAYGVVRLVLAHKSVDTTTRFYCGFESQAAMQHFDNHILALRAQGAAAFAKGRSGDPS
jgi:site-specific recombinase XerD